MMEKLSRKVIMGSGLLLLLSGLAGGLVRLGFIGLSIPTSLTRHHGVIMIGGFLGTLIGFERAVALDKLWPYLTPVSCISGTAWLIAGLQPTIGQGLITLGSATMVAVFVFITWKQPAKHSFLLTIGASCWLTGNALWLYGWTVPQIVYWWMGFLILTIAAERLELNRLMTIEGFKKWAYYTVFSGFIIGLIVKFWMNFVGMIIAGLSLIGLSIWLIIYDVARRTLQQKGEQGYSGWCMFLGYIWLMVAGILMIVFPDVQAGLYYDAILHSVFVGFVFSMIFGHSLIIFPTVIDRSIPFSKWLFLPLIILHFGLLGRVGGDLVTSAGARFWGGWINALSIVFFFMIMGSLIVWSDPTDKANISNRSNT